MTKWQSKFIAILMLAVISGALLDDLARCTYTEGTATLILTSVCYVFTCGMLTLLLIRLGREMLWCGKGHTWVDLPPQHNRDGTLRWHGYIYCSECFERKESYDLNQARKKHACPSCGTHIPW